MHNYECCSLETLGNVINLLVKKDILISKISEVSAYEEMNYSKNSESQKVIELTNLCERLVFFKPKIISSSGFVTLE